MGIPENNDEIITPQPSELTKYEATLWLPKGICIPSTNFLYKPGIRKGKYPYLYKHETVVEYQKTFIELATASELSQIMGCDYTHLILNFTFLIRDRFWLRDVSNMCKATEDALVEVMGIDDSRVVKLTANKEQQKEKQEGVNICIYGYHVK